MSASTSKEAKPPPSSSSLSGIVESIPSWVSDEQLDAYIADLILKKSRTQSQRYDQTGIGAYLKDDRIDNDDARSKRVPNTNKHFLASVIRNVEGHNQALLRQQIRDTERAVRQKRKGLAAAQELDGVGSRSGSIRKPDPVGKLRGWSDEEGTEDDGKSVPSSKAASSNSYPHNRGDEKGKHRERESSRDQDVRHSSSKMDKYFSETYDPASDIGIEDLTDGKTGLIAAGTSVESEAAWGRMTKLLSRSDEGDEKEKERRRKEAKLDRKAERDRIRAERKERKAREEREERTRRNRGRSREESDDRHSRRERSHRSRSPLHARHRREEEDHHQRATSNRSRQRKEDSDEKHADRVGDERNDTASKRHRHRHRHHRHRARHSLSPPTPASEPPPKPKVREWDLGKDLSF